MTFHRISSDMNWMKEIQCEVDLLLVLFIAFILFFFISNFEFLPWADFSVLYKVPVFRSTQYYNTCFLAYFYSDGGMNVIIHFNTDVGILLVRSDLR